MSGSALVFDRKLVVRFRERAIGRGRVAEFLLREASDGLAERLMSVNRRFARGVVLGAHNGIATEAIAATEKVDDLVSTDTSTALLAGTRGARIVCDEEALPFGDESLDLVVAAFTLHTVNDLPGCLVQIRRALRPDGLFLGVFLGGGTLGELRGALMDAELSLRGGASPRVAPFTDVRDAGALLQRAGFALPVVDADVLTVRYAAMVDLMRDLRAAGLSNALAARSRKPLARGVLEAAERAYAARYSDPDARVRATFELLNLSGWAPHDSQQKPLAPGSARTRLADALGVREISGGAKARPPRRSG